MEKQSLITIGIVTWNSASWLLTCLNALYTQTNPNFEVIVVDNASKDNSLKILDNNFPSVQVIRNSTNTGFCKAHNQIIYSSHGDYYLPLNPDVILTANYLTSMSKVVDDYPDVGMVAAKLYQGVPGDNPKRIDSTGLFIDRKRRQFLRGYEELDNGQYNQAGEVFGVDGSAPLYRRSMLEDIKIDGQYFDEAFFAHKEDVDLSWRARLFGWKCVYEPKAVAYHQRTFRPGKRKAIAEDVRLHAVKNRYLLLLKNETRLGWRRDLAPILWYDIKILAYLILFERSSLKAFPLLQKQWNNALHWRQEIQKRRKILDKDIIKWFS